MVGNAPEHGVFDSFPTRSGAPCVGGLRSGFGVLPHLLGIFGQPLGRIGAAAEDDILDPFQQPGLDVAVDPEHLRIDDAHVHSGGDGVAEERRVHRFAHGVVAAEREREVRHSARDLGVGQILLDPSRGVDERLGITVVLGDSGGDGQDVGVEYDLFGRESAGCEQVVGAAGHLDFAFVGVGLPALVEKHHDGRGAVAADFAGPAQKLLFALLERNGVDDGFALRDFEPGHEHFPLGGIYHDRHAGDFGLRSHQVQERAHGGRTVYQPVVHADVDDLRPGFDLRARHRKGFFVVALADEPRELGRTGHVGPLADVDEVGFGNDAQGLQAAQYGLVSGRGQGARRVAAHDFLQLEDVFGRGAAAAADDVDQPAPEVFAHVLGEHGGCFVVAAHDVGQSGVGMGRNAERRHGGQPL